MNKDKLNFAVIGAGAFGTSLAKVIGEKGGKVKLWAKFPHEAQEMESLRENKMFLPSHYLNDNIKISSDLCSVLKNADVVLLVIPSQFLRGVLMEMRETLTSLMRSKHVNVISCSKGIESSSGKLMSEVICEFYSDINLAVLSGPGFAKDIASGMPFSFDLAMDSMYEATDLSRVLCDYGISCYPSSDIISLEVAGALKNVVAIASGIAYGRGWGESARAAIATMGLSEITKFGHSLGADKESFLGLCGVGDLILTSSAMQSRNFSLGVELGRGKSLEDILTSRKDITEGYMTTKATFERSKKLAVHMPITRALYSVLFEKGNIEDNFLHFFHR